MKNVRIILEMTFQMCATGSIQQSVAPLFRKEICLPLTLLQLVLQCHYKIFIHGKSL